MSVRSRARARRRARAPAAAVLGAALVWLLVCWAVLQHPRVDAPAPSDALFVLGPHDPVRMAEAARLMEAGTAPVLVVATPQPRSGYSSEALRFMREKAFCPGGGDAGGRGAGERGYEVVCFEPDPSTTQGEAMALRELAGDRGWNHVSVLTYRQHVPRARLLLGRCYSGRLDALSFDYSFGPRQVLYQFLYQSGGFVKAWLTPGCDQQLPGEPKSLG